MKSIFVESSLEKIVREELERQNIEFIQEMPFRNGFVADFVILDKKTIIEVDGHPSHFTKRGKKKTRFRDWMFKRDGWKIIHFTEQEILDDVSKCVNHIFGPVWLGQVRSGKVRSGRV